MRPIVSDEAQRFTFIDDAYIPPLDSPVPTPVVSPVKTPPKKAKRGQPPKRKQLSENDTPSSLPKPTASKKKKTVSKTAIFDIEDDEVVEPPPQSITAHLHLESTIEVVSRTRGKQTSSTSTRLTQCNPFIFTVKDDFDTFIDAVASKAANCLPWHLAQSRLRWRFETPANLQPKLIANEVGYQAMIQAVKTRRKDQVVFLFVP